MWLKDSTTVRSSVAAPGSGARRGVRSPASTSAARSAIRRSGAAVRAASR